MINFVSAKIAPQPQANNATPYTNPAIKIGDIAPFLPPACVFGNGKDKHLVVTCHYFDDLERAIQYAKSIESTDNTSITIKSITETEI